MLKQIIEQVGADRKITDKLEVKNGIVYFDKFKYENGNWHQLCGDTWVNLQGGVPVCEETGDDVVFEKEMDDGLDD